MKYVFLRRFFALFVDIILISIIASLLSPFYKGEIKEVEFFDITWDVGWNYSSVIMLLYFLFFDLFDWRTIGKIVLRIKVVFNNRNTLLSRVGRTLVKCLSLILAPFMVVYYLMFKVLPQDKINNTSTHLVTGDL